MRDVKVLVFTTVFVAVVCAPLHATFTPSGLLEIHQINVQQGEATLVIGPNGTTVLMDGGKNGKGTAIVDYLESLGIYAADDLDFTIGGHMDSDHVGGLDEVIDDGYDVMVANYYNGSSKTTTTITDYKDAAATTTAGSVLTAEVGETIDLGGGATLTFVAVGGEVIGHGDVSGVTSENDLSIAVLIQYGGFDYIWGSDLGGGDDDNTCTGRSTTQENVETPLAEAIVPGGDWPLVSSEGVDVLHVNHHGSESSTNSDTMNLLKPEVAVIPVGDGQSSTWHHPRQDVVDEVLLAQGTCITASAAVVYQTEEGKPTGSETSYSGYAVGDIKITTDGVAFYTVDGTGDVSQGPDETASAGLPKQYPIDDGSALVLSEVMYDPTGSDNDLEWVELLNTGTVAVDLADYSLGNGGNDYTYSTVQLSGTIAGGATFVVGGTTSSSANGNPSFDQSINFSTDFQNSGSDADGVALFSVKAVDVTSSTVPIDAVVYGPTNGNDLIDESGSASSPEVGDASAGSSIERTSLAGAWQTQSTPTPGSSPIKGNVVLSEVMYDPTGSDDDLEWVELYNSGDVAVDLSGYSLGNGGDDYTYSTVQLSGMIAAGETFVVGGTTSSSSNADPDFDQEINFSTDFQNSGSTADGVALFDVVATSVTSSTVPVDAVVYGTTNSNGLIDENGSASSPEVGDAAAGSSIERTSLAGAWQTQSTPTPGSTPLD